MGEQRSDRCVQLAPVDLSTIGSCATSQHGAAELICGTARIAPRQDSFRYLGAPNDPSAGGLQNRFVVPIDG